MDELRRIEVGKRYPPLSSMPNSGHRARGFPTRHGDPDARTPWLDGAVWLEWRLGMMELVLVLADVTPAEVKAATNGRVYVGVHVDGSPHLRVRLLYHVAGLVSGDVPVDLDHIPQAELPDLTRLPVGACYLLTLVLIDGDRDIVRALRVVPLTPSVSRALRAAIVREPAMDVPPEAVGD